MPVLSNQVSKPEAPGSPGSPAPASPAPGTPVPGATADTQTKRRVLYGLNSFIAMLAAVAVVAGINWLSASQLDRLPANVLQWVRHDWTHTRQYSLSEQTVNTLAGLGNGYRIVTLLPENDDENRQALADLLAEYQSHAPQLAVEHLAQGVDLDKEDTLYQTIRDRFSDELAPVLEAADAGDDVLKKTNTDLQAIVQAIQAVENSQSSSLTEPIKNDLLAMRVNLTKMVEQLMRLQSAYKTALNEPLPRYAQILEGDAGLVGQLTQTRRTLTGSMQMLQRVKQRLRNNDIYKAERLGTALLRELDQAVNTLQLSKATRGYDEAADTLSRGACVIVLGPEAGNARVIAADRLFVSGSADTSPRFLGEELITGALLSIKLSPPPLAIFVLSGRSAALEPNGVFQSVAQRLRAIGFEVTQWHVQQRLNEPGNPHRPDPKDAAKPGQACVYIFMPYESMQANAQPSMAEDQAMQRFLDVMQDKLQSDDGVMVMTKPEAKPVTGESKVASLLRPLGIVPLSHRPILKEVVVGQIPQPTWELGFTDWPENHPITRSLQGQPGVMFLSTPITVLSDGNATNKSIVRMPLVELKGDRLWTLDDFANINQGELKFNPDAAKSVYTPAVAVEDGPRRLVAVSAEAWADDRIATRGRDGSVNTAAYYGQLFPGNTELFINSTLWLAHLDDLIAESPRTQDIRRIRALSTTEQTGIKTLLLGGVPAAIGLAGLIVWGIRRRG